MLISIILILALAALLYTLALIVAAWIKFKCPVCNQYGLKAKNAYKWDGRPGGGVISYYLCQNCQARLKYNMKQYELATELEWDQYGNNQIK